MAFYYLFDALFPKSMIIIAKYDLLEVLNLLSIELFTIFKHNRWILFYSI